MRTKGAERHNAVTRTVWRYTCVVDCKNGDRRKFDVVLRRRNDAEVTRQMMTVPGAIRGRIIQLDREIYAMEPETFIRKATKIWSETVLIG